MKMTAHSRLTLLLMVALFGITNIKADDKKTTIETARATIEMVANLVKAKEMSRLDILHIPYNIAGGASGDPRNMVKSYMYKLVIRDFGAIKERETLVKALQETQIDLVTPGIDPRWGLIFYDERENERATILMNTLGDQVFLNGVAFGVRSKLLSWLERNYLMSFRAK